MRFCAFASRTGKELLRDPLNLSLSLGFPLFMLVLLSLLGKSIPGEIPMFEITRLAPGIVLFSYGFLTLFMALLLAQDRSGAFLVRLQSSPLRPAGFFLGYSLPALPIALLQAAVCFTAAFCFGLKADLGVLAALLVLLPTAILFLSVGLILGCVLNDKAVGGVGSIFLNVATIAAGVWFPLDAMEGTTFSRICSALPFLHGVQAASSALALDWIGVWQHLSVVLPWTAGTMLLAVFVFSRTMRASR